MDQLFKTQHLLAQALAVAQKCMPSDRHMTEARIHIRQALTRVENVAKSEARKQKNQGPTNHAQWWDSVMAGVANSSHANTSNSPYANMSEQAAMRTLSQLDKMIAEQQKIIDSVEQDVNSKTSPNGPEILND